MKKYFDNRFRLTDNQIRIILLVSIGKTSKEISDILGNSSRSVEGSVRIISNKCEFNNKSDMIRYGILELENTILSRRKTVKRKGKSVKLNFNEEIEVNSLL